MKRLLLTFLVCTGAFFLSAQNDPFKGELYVGAGAGGMATSIDFVPSIPQELVFSYQGGIAAKYVSEKHLGLAVELNFSKKGWKEEFDPEEGYAYQRSLTYLDVPFMTHVYFGNRTRFILNAGPQISFLIGENAVMNQALADHVASVQESDPGSPIGEPYKPMSEMKRVDYGLIGGLGLELRTGIGVFDLEGRYYFGLGDVFTSRRSEDAYFSRSAHRVITAKLTYYIPIR